MTNRRRFVSMIATTLSKGSILCGLLIVFTLISRDASNGRQPATVPWIYNAGEVRVAFPSANEYDSSLARTIAGIVSGAPALPGIPRSPRTPRQVTISLVREFRTDVDGVAVPEHQTIILPLKRVSTWDSRYLRRVILHERAHLQLRDSFEGVFFPQWLEEGYAELVSGGLTCEALARVHVSIMWRGSGSVLTRLEEDEFETRRLAYDHFTAFAEYLDRNYDSLITNGRFFQKLRTVDLDTALEQETGMPLGTLVERWWADLAHGPGPTFANCVVPFDSTSQ